MNKFHNLSKLSSWMQDFMTEVFKILANNSYLAEQMKSMSEIGQAEMPPEIKKIMSELSNGEAKPRTIAPIP